MIDLISRALFHAFVFTRRRVWVNEHYGWGGRAWTGRL